MRRTEEKQVSGQSKKWEDNLLALPNISENYLDDFTKQVGYALFNYYSPRS